MAPPCQATWGACVAQRSRSNEPGKRGVAKSRLQIFPCLPAVRARHHLSFHSARFAYVCEENGQESLAVAIGGLAKLVRRATNATELDEVTRDVLATGHGPKHMRSTARQDHRPAPITRVRGRVQVISFEKAKGPRCRPGLAA